ncbi:AI-2E family transporter [Tropicimonas sp. IMCC6043]|uniref:AI-2E family transporter n=1 Tax=Tropicimonas sp. IMCC6043 TaxID=2510645 RepID=UPI00101C700A|nr:AI-2E family transporter [Tropicimonas sp. IMCC6043]RYH07909.1 AI-2E family transporter [Tropicimonas sp. IMCC6043]
MDNNPERFQDRATSGQSVTAPGWAVIGIFLLLLVAGLAYARAFLMPVVLAVLLQLVFSPVRRRFERLGLSPGLSAMLIVGTLLFAGGAGVASLAVPVGKWVERAPMIGWEFRQKMEEIRGATEGVRKAAEQIDKLASGEDVTEKDPEVQRVQVEESGSALTLVMSVPAVVAQVVFTLILLFFLLSSGDMFYEKIVFVMPTFKDKRRAIRIAHDIERKLSRYLLTITTINAVLGVAIGFAMWWFGMPSPALFAILAFLLNFIPYIGSLFGVSLSFVVGVVSLDHFGEAIVPAFAYLALTSIEGQFVTPYFVGRNLRLNTVVVFVSVTFFAWLWSVVGMLVATPLLVAVRTFCEHIPALEGLGHFLSARGAESQTQSDAEQDS